MRPLGVFDIRLAAYKIHTTYNYSFCIPDSYNYTLTNDRILVFCTYLLSRMSIKNSINEVIQIKVEGDCFPQKLSAEATLEANSNRCSKDSTSDELSNTKVFLIFINLKFHICDNRYTTILTTSLHHIAPRSKLDHPKSLWLISRGY